MTAMAAGGVLLPGAAGFRSAIPQATRKDAQERARDPQESEPLYNLSPG
jgi:hypothetical protein